MRLPALALLGISALTSPAIAGPCAQQSLTAHAMAIANTAIPPDGGVLVALIGMGGWELPSETLDNTGWQFVDGTTKTAPVVVPLAPGLAVFKPPAGTGTIKLDEPKRTVVTVKRVADALPLLPAPAVASIVHTTYVAPPGPRPGNRTSSTVTAKLTAAKPDQAVAMILWEDKTPVAWTAAAGLEPTERVVELFRSRGRCETVIPGIVETTPGRKVSVAWVDVHGRVGARSKVLVVAKGKP
jgi:hypothetical protein